MFSSGIGSFGMSQGFGMGPMGGLDTQSSQVAPTDGARKPRQEAKETCLPVTIRAIDVAFERRGESGEELKFYGCAEPQMVLLVASVESMVRQAASLEVTLNDATGRIKGRWFLSDPQEGELERIVAGSYVSVFGEVRSSPVRHIAVKGMRPIESADEVSYHMIEAAHAALKLQRKAAGSDKEPATPASKKEKVDEVAVGTAAGSDLTPEKQQPRAPVAANPYSAAAAATAVADAAKPSNDAPMEPAPKGPPAGAELRAAVLAVLRDASVGPEGLHLDVIAPKAGGAAVADVRAMVTELVDDGELYTTITEEHFAAV